MPISAKKITKSSEECDYLTLAKISCYPILEDAWPEWDTIVSKVVPADYYLRDACEGSEHQPLEGSEQDKELWIRCRLDYLSDRLDASRAYWLDFEIRRFLGKEPRS